MRGKMANIPGYTCTSWPSCVCAPCCGDSLANRSRSCSRSNIAGRSAMLSFFDNRGDGREETVRNRAFRRKKNTMYPATSVLVSVTGGRVTQPGGRQSVPRADDGGAGKARQRTYHSSLHIIDFDRGGRLIMCYIFMCRLQPRVRFVRVLCSILSRVIRRRREMATRDERERGVRVLPNGGKHALAG